MKRVLLFACLSVSLGLAACDALNPNEYSILIDYSQPLTPESAGIIQTTSAPGVPVSVRTRDGVLSLTVLLDGPGVIKPRHYWFFGPTFRPATGPELFSFVRDHRDVSQNKDICALGTNYADKDGKKVGEFPLVRNGHRLGYYYASSCPWKLLVLK
jgi:hypothetical protein